MLILCTKLPATNISNFTALPLLCKYPKSENFNFGVLKVMIFDVVYA